MLRGDLKGSSFGFIAIDERWTLEGENEVRWLMDVDLIDVGPVSLQAYASTSVQARSRRRHAPLRRVSFRRASSDMERLARLQRIGYHVRSIKDRTDAERLVVLDELKDRVDNGAEQLLARKRYRRSLQHFVVGPRFHSEEKELKCLQPKLLN